MNTVKRGVFTGAAAFGFLKAWNGNRKVNTALRRKRKGKPLSKEQERLIAELEGKEPEVTDVLQYLKSKTVWAAIVVEAWGLVQVFLEGGVFTKEAVSTLVIGIVMVILRRVTNQPLSAK